MARNLSSLDGESCGGELVKQLPPLDGDRVAPLKCTYQTPIRGIRLLPFRRFGDEKTFCCDVYDGHFGRCGGVWRKEASNAASEPSSVG
jgi:hypothetical protein